MYSHVVLGGTFDHLHSGHRDLLSMAFTKSKKVSIGLTKASMNTKKEAYLQIQSYAVRKKEILDYARSLGREKDITIIPIHDIYGKTLQDDTLQAIIVTPHTLAGADTINRKRIEKNLNQLHIEICPLRKDSYGVIISSSRIRLGEIDREGYHYSDIFRDNIAISDHAKKILQRPIGKNCRINKLRASHVPIVVVGDVSTHHCSEQNIAFQSAYIDGKSKHTDHTFTPSNEYHIQETTIHNQAGTISRESAEMIQANIHSQNKYIYKISGEEDLLTVAAVVLLPFGTLIVYGYPFHPQTMRCIQITERTKARFAAILSR